MPSSIKLYSLRSLLLTVGSLAMVGGTASRALAQGEFFAPPPAPSLSGGPLATDGRSADPNGYYDHLPAEPLTAESYLPVNLDLSQESGGTVEERLQAIEEALAKDEAAAQKKKEADAEKPTIKFAGRIHTDYWAFPEVDTGPGLIEAPDGDPEDRFLFRRVRLGVSGTIPDNMAYKLDVDFNRPDTAQFKDVYFGWTDLFLLQTVFVGNQKRPYGLDHLNSSNANVFLERPLVIESINQDARRWGICHYGVSRDEQFNWRLGFYMGQDVQSIGTATATPDDEDYQGEFAGRFAHTFWYDDSSDGRGYGHWAVAGTVASTDGDAGGNSTARFRSRPEARTSERWIDTGVIDNADDYQLLALEGVLNWGSFQVVSEYQQLWLNRNPGDQLSFNGFYAYASWVLTGEHHPWDRATGTLKALKPFENFWLVDTCDDGVAAGWGAWEIAARYSYADFSDEDIFGGEGHNTTLGLQWHWNQWSRMQFNYVYGTLDDRFDDNDLGEPRNGDYHILGTRFIFYF